MKNILLIFAVAFSISACKKEKLCSQIEGHYRLTEVIASGSTQSIPDTGVDYAINHNAVFADNIIIDGNQNFTGYTGAKGSVTFHSDKIDCNKILEVQPTYFISGTGTTSYKYTKI